MVSSPRVRNSKPPQSPASLPGAASRHRKPSPGGSAWRGKAARIAAAVVATLAVLIVGWPPAARLMAGAPNLSWVNEAEALGMQLAAPLGLQARLEPEVVSFGLATAPGYRNPLRGVIALVPERVDMGVDFSGSGPVYAVGDAVITNASGDNGGWPGGGWITYQLTDGPDAGLTVFVAEDVKPAVQVGQRVTPSTVVATMFEGGDGIETGWAQASGMSAESQLSEAGGIGGNGPFPTRIGISFEELLQSLGVPAAPNRAQTAYGILPANYPANGK